MSSAPTAAAPGPAATHSSGAASPLREAMRRLGRSRQGLIGAFFVVLVIAAGLLAPLLSALEGQDPDTFHGDLVDAANGGTPLGIFGGVSGDHWFGVEPQTGRDLFSLVTYGIRTSVGIGIVATLLGVTFGVILGLAMGYLGGWFAAVMGRFVDFMFGFPSLLFLIAIQLVVPPDFSRPVLLALSLALFGWVGTARLVHGQARQLAAREFVEAARASGTSTWRILTVEMLPNLVGTVVVIFALGFPATVGAGAGLSFLGVGVPPTTPELGRLIASSVTWTYTGADAAYLLFPGGALFLLVLGSTLFGDALRDAFDVREEGVRP